MDSLVSTEWLEQHLDEPGIAIADASWHMPASGRSGREEFAGAHVPGARFLDLDELSDRSNPAPHMLPGAQEFGEAMGRLGIGSDDLIVVYDNSPLRTAARGWFMLRHFGASNVAILDGGFQKWVAEGRPTSRDVTNVETRHFDATERGDEVVTKRQLLSGIDTPLIDARGPGRFEGTEPDPRPGVEPGHIPGARNIPYSSIYREDGTFRSPDELRALFAEAGADPREPFIATCGSGVTANSIIFGAHLLGYDQSRLYDGSWTEWGSDPATPKAVGPA